MARQTSDLTLVSMIQQMRLHRLFKPVGSSFIVGLLLLPVLLPAQSAQAQSNDEVVFQTLDPLETLSTSQPVNNDAVARRLTRIEQLLRSQSAMQNAGNSRDTDGSQPSRDTLQAILDRLDRIEASLTGGFTAASSGNNTSSILAGDDQTAADLRVRLSSLEETLRNISGQSEQVLQLIQSNELARQKDREDSEYRFQALEGKMRQQANKGSSEPQIIGTIPGTAPIENSVATGNNTTANLVGEGDLSILNGSQADGRGELNDPLALYERAMAALKQGEYGNARLDFKQLIAKYPKHIRAGNAQYWLGESHYVQGNYKKAAEAFLVGYTEYAANNKGPDSLLKLGMTLIAMGEIKTGCDAFSELKANFPDAPDAVTKRAEIEKKRAGCK